MTSVLDKLNLRPQERRLVVIVAVVVFVVLNVWLVFPNFGALAKTKKAIADTETLIGTYETEIKNEPAYKKQINELSTQGAIVASEEQGLRLSTEIISQATISGVNIQNSSPVLRQSSGGRTNAFYEEQSQTVTVNTGERELIDFLFSLGARETLIRVRNMNLGRDPSQMRLQGTLTLVKSFQRKSPPKASASAAVAAKTNPPAKAAPPAKVAPPPPKDTPKPVKNPEPPKTNAIPKRIPPAKTP